MAYSPSPKFVRLRSAAMLEDQLKAHDLSGAQLARLAGISRGTISLLRLEKTRSTLLDNARAIERALKVKRGELFDYTLVTRATAKPAAKPAAKRAA